MASQPTYSYHYATTVISCYFTTWMDTFTFVKGPQTWTAPTTARCEEGPDSYANTKAKRPAKADPKTPLPVAATTPPEDDLVLVGAGIMEVVLEGGWPSGLVQLTLDGIMY